MMIMEIDPQYVNLIAPASYIRSNGFFDGDPDIIFEYHPCFPKCPKSSRENFAWMK